MPQALAAPIPPKKLKGMEMTSAGTTDYQEGQGTDDPGAPGCRIAHDQVDHRRQDGQCQGTVADSRGIISCELRNKVLRFGLLHAGVLYQIQDLGYGGFSKFLGSTDLK